MLGSRKSLITIQNDQSLYLHKQTKDFDFYENLLNFFFFFTTEKTLKHERKKRKLEAL